MRRQTGLVVSCGEVLKAKSHVVVYTKERDEDKESVGSSYHVAVQDERDTLSPIRVGEELEDVSWCYHISVDDGKPQEDEDAKDAPPEFEEGVKTTVDALKEINLGTDEDQRPTYVNSLLTVDEESAYVELLKEYKDVFSWSYKEMLGLDPKVVVHHLAVKNGTRPIKQAQRRFRPELVPLIENEVNKLIEAGFIREVKFPTWISSIVPVRKKNGQIRVCVDFRDLNNACPKDEFSLPIAELMIDATTGYEAMSFMDGSSGYNQIRMSPKDEELTAFRTPKVLAAPVPGKPLILYISAQESSVGALLAQENSKGKENALYYLSRMMTPNELKYSPIEKLCLALVFSIQKMKHYFQAHVVRLISKANPIKFVMSKPVLSDRLARWYLQFQQFEIVYVPQKAVKGQAFADFLADHPIPDDWELTDELPDEDAMVIEIQRPWKMYFDGAAHREGAGAGVIFVTSQGEVLPYSFTLTQCFSNNVAEYQALILGLEMAVDMKQLQLQVFGDSELVINQLLGTYEVKKPELRPYHHYAQKLIGWLGNVTLQHVPRKENKKADALATLASSLTLPDQAQITICQKWIVPPEDDEDEESKLELLVAVTEAEKVDWRQTMIDYLCYSILPEDPKRKTEIRRRAPRFLYYKDTLYRRSFEGVLLRCLGEEEATQAMQEAHYGVCGSHQSGPKLHFHIKRMGYYWPTMVKDCLDYARSCKACQFHANFIHQPPEVLHPTVASWPFDAWGLDVVGPLPKSSGGHLYILAATDYFSKWAEVVALKEVKKENVENFIRVNIIYRFGIPSYIITDNGKPFSNKLMTKICELFGFKQRNSSMYYAAANELAEAFNKTLCNLLKKVVSKSKRDWHDRMEEALWVYRTTHRTPTQATPYSLVCGAEAVLPLERQIPSLRLAIQEGLTEEENARLRLKELEVLDEKRLEAQQSLECYQARLSRAFNKKVRLRSFQVGDQVLAVRRPIIISHKSGSKFTSKWDGPYVVQEAYTSGAYKLIDADGLRISPINGKFLKMYYP
ncbi:uncharacterized protein LOC132612963 [Lycium barbarum]|uniref:uncharacterized protein LOC132612963 n=1 Tax=Lycium barbarum TaxID=112863 RepID=UPI00293EA7A7|nr:uncharacterized protein LOC132612963 [Lycium barbarum]